MDKLDRALAKVRSGQPLHLLSLQDLTLLEKHFESERNPLAKAVHTEILTRI